MFHMVMISLLACLMQFLVHTFLEVQNCLQYLYILEITSNSVLQCKRAVVLGISFLTNKILFLLFPQNMCTLI